MQKTFFNKTAKPSNKFSYLKAIAIASALLILPLQSFAEKAKHYGDINDEDGKYVAWTAESDTVKTSHQLKSTKSKTVKMQTKKLSEGALNKEYRTGYGDEGYDQD
ncbi:hypothetical protein [Kaarinaea lacus]